MKVINKTNGNLICNNCNVAEKFYDRAKGLLGRKSINSDEGLLIKRCRSIHSFFMRFPICAIFIDKNNKVVKILDNFKVNILSGYYIKAKDVIELPPLKAEETGTKIGDILEFKD